jgi:endonuclease YncB( thermonuclease family)
MSAGTFPAACAEGERMRTRLLLLGTILAFALSAGLISAETFTARVVGVTDGDTITVLAPGNVQHRIRLASIDAPEHDQAFGTRSKQNLSQLVFGKTVMLDCGKEESYGRLVCKVLLPNGEDADLDQVKAGLAWHYKQFENEQTPADRVAYAAAEDTAREAHRGLWADAHPIPPWDFRHGTQAQLCFDKANHRVDCGAQYAGPVRGNARSHIYQWPGCPYYDTISAYNRVEFPSAQAAEAAGYRAAKNCP